MKLSLLAAVPLALAFLVAAPTDADAGKRIRTRSCTAAGKTNIAQAVDFLNDHLGQLQNAPISFAKRRPKRRRIKRRMGRRFNKLKYSCATDSKCPVGGTTTGRHSGGIIGRKVQMCYENMVHRGFGFCYFVGVMAHEFGHATGVEKSDQHNDHTNAERLNDPVYRLGFYAEELCKQAGLDRPLDRIVGRTLAY